MTKQKTIEIWNKLYGNKEEVTDYAGRRIKKSACGNPNSRYFPTIDHIRPLSKGGSNTLGNIILCHRDTNEEKDNKFPHWKTNNKRFIAIRVRGSRTSYKIYEY